MERKPDMRVVWPNGRRSQAYSAPRHQCRFPRAFGWCEEEISKRYPQFEMCQSHVLHIWGTVQRDLHDRDVDPNEALFGKDTGRHWLSIKWEQEYERQRKEEKASDVGTIYYLRIGSDIKIGYTKDFYRRIRQYPPTAQVLATRPGTRRDERGLHTRFAEYRVAGREWYRRGRSLMDHIKAMAETHGAWDPRDPIEVNGPTPQERQVRDMRWPKPGRIVS